MNSKKLFFKKVDCVFRLISDVSISEMEQLKKPSLFLGLKKIIPQIIIDYNSFESF